MKTPAVIILVFSIAATAAAQDQQLGARTKGMGGSYTAFEDDPVSIWLNPAGIATQPNQMSIDYQTYTTYPLQRKLNSGAVDFSAQAATTLVDPAFIPSFLGLVFQVGTPDDAMALGICYARPFHISYSFDHVEDPTTTVFVPDSNVQESFSRFRATFAKDFRLEAPGQPGFFTHISVGVGVDVGYETWHFDGSTQSITDTSTAPGYGGGILVGLYDNTEDIKVNLGVAYQSSIRWHFNVDPQLFPAFDMPQQINAGLTGYLLPGQRLRATVDFQWVQWSKTAEAPAFEGQPRFRDSTNYSVGVEYRYTVNQKINLYPRAGFRRFEAPWANKDDLPMTSNYKLLLDTKGGTFNIITAGLGFSYTDDRGKSWVIDLGTDFGGDSFNMALGFTYEI
jgi:long-subunit fatty acid transport protein